MSNRSRGTKEKLKERLLARAGRIPTSTLGRLGPTAAAAARGGGLMLGRRVFGGEELDGDKVAAWVAQVGQLKGVAMKMGQIMSYIDVALPEELRDALSVLQTHAPPMPVERVREIIRSELESAPAAVLLATLESVPLAAASIGQVHGATLGDGTRVAVKVQYPEIEQAIVSDFAPAAVGTRLASLFYPGAEIDGFIAEARERFLEECNYQHEATCQERFGEVLREHPTLVVPVVHRAFSSRRVLTTTFVQGETFDGLLAGDPPAELRDRYGAALFDLYIGTLFRHGLYNCDPHPGNYLFTAEGKIAALDYGCTRQFEPEFVDDLAQLARAVRADDPAELHAAFCALGMVDDTKKYDFDTARALVRAFHGPMLVDRVTRIQPDAAMGMQDIFAKKRQLLKLRLPGEFLFLFRIRFGLMAVLARLGARANWHDLEQGALDAWCELRSRENPGSAGPPPH